MRLSRPLPVMAVLFTVALLQSGPLCAQSESSRGNILLLVADDLGIDQVGFYGLNPDAPSTPVLDGLAANGVVFRRVWANPLCSTTRATIQTGRYSFRTGIGASVTTSGGGLPLEELTLPEMLDAGTGRSYRHAAFGKWHLGDPATGGPLAPNLAGYSHFAGNLHGVSDYFFWQKIVDGVVAPTARYATSATVDDAAAWIAGAEEPWFCYVAFNAPHNPLHVPPDHLHDVDLTGPNYFDQRLRFRAMVQAMDTEIGRLLNGLGDARERTTVIYLGDNGTDRAMRWTGLRPRQSKGRLYQHGLLVPLVVSGPSVAEPGRECNALVNTTDLFATIADLAGAEFEARRLDSVSLAPYLADPDAPARRSWVYAESFRPHGPRPYSDWAAAVTDGEYKLIVSKHHVYHSRRREFFHLASDPFEHVDLTALGLMDAPARARMRVLEARMAALWSLPGSK